MRLELLNGIDPDFEPLVYGYASLGLLDDAHYWFEMLRSQWPPGEPPMYVTLYLSRLGGLRWLSADLEQTEKLLAAEGPFDEPYILGYGGLAQIQAGDTAKGIEWLERGITAAQQEIVPDDPPDHIDYSLLNENWLTEVVVLLAERLAFAYRDTGQDQLAEEALLFLDQEYETSTNRNGPWILEKARVDTRAEG